MNDIDHILELAISAHGGLARWNSIASIEAELSIDGFLFAAKRRPPLKRVRVWASLDEPRFVFHDYPQPGWRGEFLGNEEVRIVSPDGTVASRREHPRDAFHGLRREFAWDDLDFLYFGAYATWNYLVTPFVFTRPGFDFKRVPPNEENSIRLRVSFPDDIPTHCREQIFHFAPDGKLLRLDYTAEVIGRWAHAAHLCQDYESFSGILAPTRRRVRPLFGLRQPLPWPTLVAIDIHDLQPIDRELGQPIPDRRGPDKNR
jgi:hypothetical protein